MIYRLLYIIIVVIITAQTSLGQIGKTMPLDVEKQIDNLIVESKKFMVKDPKKAANSLNKIAIIYSRYQNPKKAISYFNESAKIYENISDYRNIFIIYSNIAVLYTQFQNDDLTLATVYFGKSLELRRKFGSKADRSSGLVDVAYMLVLDKKFDKAIELLKESLSIATSINNSKLILSCYNLLGKCYRGMNNKNLQKDYEDKFSTYLKYLEGQKVNSELKQKEEEKKKVEAEYEADKLAKELSFDLEMAKKQAKEESLKRGQDSLKQVAELNNLQKQNLEKDKIYQKQQLEAQVAIQKRQQLAIYTMGAAIILVLLLVALSIYRLFERKKNMEILSKQNEEIRKQKDELDIKTHELQSVYAILSRQQEDVMSSINYAERIQRTILPQTKELNNYVPNAFILFQPRDKVSGDYYWFKRIAPNINGQVNAEDPNNKQERIIISAIDCTGHGVPGALLSMIANNLLHSIIVKDRIYDPGKILDKMNRGIRKILKQDISESREGMDMSIAVVYPTEGYIEFGGAKGMMFMIPEDGELEIVKGDFDGIGGFEFDPDKFFSTKRLYLEKTTTFYQFSDGYIDQFGGDKGKKLQTKGFKELVYSIHKEDFDVQRDILQDRLQQWKGDIEQVDDILVIGYKVDIAAPHNSLITGSTETSYSISEFK